ncbi:MAG: Haloacid dehalogenase superfamily, subfamily variant 3 with third motif having or [Hydrocarboniphaga sp.]|uniref:HAD-IA family hydrolase n=1 Tax=Hydrocarboniphaga sp. TaxID=2033016 RepID=UPI00260339BA|nr:HAD-IA family hydrolase [Hydrocarboniphaga sp.]MDB5970757.1 Haloacid dehalogenase superfamily, subfamily variant 3 with third motif having or [Hydrocarboniphaga sp.]
MKLRALLLDVDGTLADTESHGHRPAYNQAFRQLGLKFRWNQRLYRKLLEQPGGRERLTYYLRHYHPELGPQADAARTDEAAWVDRVHEIKSWYFRAYVRKGKVPLRPGIARLIAEAKAAGVKVALVSNASRESLNAVLNHSMPGLADQVDLIVSGADVATKKPSPESYLRALSQLNLQPGQCIALEDSAMGLKAATAAGITTIITRNENTLDDDFSSASLVLDGLGEPESPVAAIRGKLEGGWLTLADAQAMLTTAYSRAA